MKGIHAHLATHSFKTERIPIRRPNENVLKPSQLIRKLNRPMQLQIPVSNAASFVIISRQSRCLRIQSAELIFCPCINSFCSNVDCSLNLSKLLRN